MCPHVWAQGLSFEAIVKAGLEMDSNPRRLNGAGSAVDGLERFYSELGLSSYGSGQSIVGSLRIGVKQFHNAAEEDAVVSQLISTFQRLLVGDLGVYFGLTGRDRNERDHLRDYSRLSGNCGVFFRPENVSVFFGPTIGFFLYKPTPQLSYQSSGLSSQIGGEVADILEFSVGYGLTFRDYDQDRIVNDEQLGQQYVEGQTREDTGHTVSFSATIQTDFVGMLEIVWQRNSSNSYAKGFSRIMGRLSATVSLPLDIFLSGQASLQRTIFDDEVLIDPVVAVDDDNRNSLILSVSRDLLDWLRLEFRYSLYTQEFGGDDMDYDRHLFYGGLMAWTGS